MCWILNESLTGFGVWMLGDSDSVDHERQAPRTALENQRATSVRRRNGVPHAVNTDQSIGVGDAWLFQHDVVRHRASRAIAAQRQIDRRAVHA